MNTHAQCLFVGFVACLACGSLISAASTDARLPSVVVSSNADLQKQADSFVSQVLIAPHGESLARWRSPLCPLVKGVAREDGEYLLEKLSQIASSIGIPLGGEKCRPNFYVILSPDPDAFVKAWSKRDTTMFGDASGAKIDEFKKSTDPIRSWYNVSLATADGSAIATGGAALGSDGTSSNPTGVNSISNNAAAFNGIPSNSHASATRLSYNEVRAITQVAVIVDMRKSTGVKYDQLAAYIAMVGFAEVRRNSDAGVPTVLTLFAADPKTVPTGLTEWDQALLKALYQTEQSGRTQLQQIRVSVGHAMAH